MNSRFQCPEFTDNPMDLPDDLSSHPRPDIEGGIPLEVFGRVAHLHIERNEDDDSTVRQWKVAAFIRSPKGRWCRLDSATDFRQGDTPDDIGCAFAADVARMVVQTLEGS